MLVVIFRCLIIFTLLVFFIRLMGKRTIGELQPYEFVITLALADLSCIPIQDISISLLYGIIPLTILFLAHFFLTLFTAKSVKMRRFLNGKPIIVIDDMGINTTELKKLNLDVNDLLAMIRQQGYFSISEIKYAIVETNGKLSIMPDSNASAPETIPTVLVVEGKIMSENLSMLNFTSDQVMNIIEQNQLKINDIVLMSAESKSIFLQPKDKKFFFVEEK